MSQFQPQLWEKFAPEIEAKTFNFSEELPWGGESRRLDFAIFPTGFYFRRAKHRGREWNFWLSDSNSVSVSHLENRREYLAKALEKQPIERRLLLSETMRRELRGPFAHHRWRVVFRAQNGAPIFGSPFVGFIELSAQSFRFGVPKSSLESYFGAAWNTQTLPDVSASQLWDFLGELWADPSSDLRRAAFFAAQSNEGKAEFCSPLDTEMEAIRDDLQTAISLCARPAEPSELHVFPRSKTHDIAVDHAIFPRRDKAIAKADFVFFERILERFLRGDEQFGNEQFGNEQFEAMRLRLWAASSHRLGNFVVGPDAFDSSHEKLEAVLRLSERWRDWPEGTQWLNRKLEGG